MADEATTVARACDKARAGLRLSLEEQRAVARAVLARVEEMEGEKVEEEKKEEEEKEEKKKKKKKKTKSKHHVATATEKLENLGVGGEEVGGEEFVPSRTKAKKKEHARGVGVLGGLGGLELDGGAAGGEGGNGGEEDDDDDEES